LELVGGFGEVLSPSLLLVSAVMVSVGNPSICGMTLGRVINREMTLDTMRRREK